MCSGYADAERDGEGSEGEPYLIVMLNGEGVTETDDLEREAEGHYSYNYTADELREFQSGPLNVPLVLTDSSGLLLVEIPCEIRAVYAACSPFILATFD